MNAFHTETRYERKIGLRGEPLDPRNDSRRDMFQVEEPQYSFKRAHPPPNDFSGVPGNHQAPQSFLANPISEMEGRHRFLEAEYRSYLQAGLSRPKSRTPDPTGHRRLVEASYQGEVEKRRKEVLQEPQDEIYFPFGRPGGGAPLRDPKSRFLEDVPSPQLATKERTRRAEQSPTKIVSGTSAQDREIKARQQEEMRRLLDEQMNQRRRRQEEEKQARLAEEKVEEERILRQRKEMEEEYRRELRSREGFHEEPAAIPTPHGESEGRLHPPRSGGRGNRHPNKPSANKYSKPVNLDPPPAEVEYLRDGPDPPRPKYIVPAFAHEEKLQKLRDEMAGRQQSLQDLILKLKEESAGLSAKQHEAMREFELMCADLKAKKTHSDSQSMYRPAPMQYITGPWREAVRPRLQQETRFLPFSKAGLSVVSGGAERQSSSYSPAFPPTQSLPREVLYGEVESPEVSAQLSRLDSILDYCKDLSAYRPAESVPSEAG